MMIALISFNANAAMYIVGSDPFGNWNPGNGVEMTLENGVYTYTTAINGTIYFVFGDGLDSNWNVFNPNYRIGPTGNTDQEVTAGEWTTTQKAPDGSKSYKFIGTGGDYVFTFDPTNMQFKVEGYVAPIEINTYSVAGTPASIFGAEWSETNTATEMTLVDGLYTWTAEDVALTAGTKVEFKVVGNHDWGFAWPADNYEWEVPENGTYKLVFTFNPDTQEVGLTPTKNEDGPVVDDYYIVAGTQNLFGSNWAATDSLNLMTEIDGGMFIWTKEGFEATAGTEVEFKVVANGNWSTCWPPSDEEGDHNWYYKFEEDGVYAVTINFNEETKEINLDAVRTGDLPEPPAPEVDPVYIMGDVNNLGWDPSKGVEMTYNEGIYTAEITTQNQGDLGVAYFGFTKKLADAMSEDGWTDIEPYRFGPVSEGAFVMTEELLNQSIELDLEGSYESVAIPEGTWTVTVDLANGLLKINGTWPTDTVIPEPAADVYIMGEVNGNGWATNVGVKMTLNEGVYTANITTAGENNGLSYFSFTKQLAETEDDWDAIAPYRFGAVSDGDFIMTEELLGQECDLATDGSYNAIAIPAGEWALTVDLENNKFTINGTWPTDTVIPEPTTDVYIIGEVNGNIWATNVGVKMTLNEGVYTANITTDGQSGGLSYFSFTKQLADSAADWEAIAPYRFGPVSEGDFIMTEELLGQECALTTDGSNAIAIPAGEWTVTVDLENLIFTINGEWPETPGPEPYDGDVYIMGEVNDNGGWFTNKGVKMTRDAENNVYTATITTAGENDGYSYFSFTKQLAEGEADWDAIAPYRFGAVSEGDFLVTEELLGQELALENAGDAYKIEAGTWNLTLSVDNMTLTIEKAEEPAVLRGDVDQNGTVAIADVTTLIDLLLKNGETPAEADTNLDGFTTIGDVTVLIDYLLGGNWPAAE